MKREVHDVYLKLQVDEDCLVFPWEFLTLLPQVGGCGPLCKWKLPDSGCCQLTQLSFKAALAPEQWVLRAEAMAPGFYFWLLVVWLVVTTAEGKSLSFYLLCVGYIINTIWENRCGFHGYRFPYIGNVCICYHQPIWIKWKAGFAHLKTWIQVLVLLLWF